MRIPPNYGPKYTREFHAAFEDVARTQRTAAGAVSPRGLRRPARAVPVRRHSPQRAGPADDSGHPVAGPAAAAGYPPDPSKWGNYANLQAIFANQAPVSQTPSPARDRADRLTAARVRRHHRRAHALGVRSRPHPGCVQSARAVRQRARSRGHPVQAGLALQRTKSSARRWWRPTSPAISKRTLLDRPKSWRPLVYCWRGGKRSGAFTHVLREIGWDARALDGGYKAFRRTVMSELPGLTGRWRWRVRVRSHRLGQEPAAGHAGAPWRTGPRPRAARRPPRVGPGQPAGRPAAEPEDVREPAVGPSAPLRTGASRLRRIGEQEDRRAAGASASCSTRCGPARACSWRSTARPVCGC